MATDGQRGDWQAFCPGFSDNGGLPPEHANAHVHDSRDQPIENRRQSATVRFQRRRCFLTSVVGWAGVCQRYRPGCFTRLHFCVMISFLRSFLFSLA